MERDRVESSWINNRKFLVRCRRLSIGLNDQKPDRKECLMSLVEATDCRVVDADWNLTGCNC